MTGAELANVRRRLVGCVLYGGDSPLAERAALHRQTLRTAAAAELSSVATDVPERYPRRRAGRRCRERPPWGRHHVDIDLGRQACTG